VAIAQLERRLGDAGCKAVRDDTIDLHFTVGMGIRNEWGLWDQTAPLNRWFRENLKLGHADDMSGIILTSLGRRLRGEPLNLEEQVKIYQKHWHQQGINPLTQ
jgi:hypothetical protein